MFKLIGIDNKYYVVEISKIVLAEQLIYSINKTQIMILFFTPAPYSNIYANHIGYFRFVKK